MSRKKQKQPHLTCECCHKTSRKVKAKNGYTLCSKCWWKKFRPHFVRGGGCSGK